MVSEWLGGGGPVETGLAKIFEVLLNPIWLGGQETQHRLNYVVKREMSFSFILACALFYLDIGVCSGGFWSVACNVSCYIAGRTEQPGIAEFSSVFHI